MLPAISSIGSIYRQELFYWGQIRNHDEKISAGTCPDLS